MATQGNENNSAPLTSDNSNQNERTALLRTTRNSTARRRKLFVTLCILVTELCERLTFYGVAANLVLFCMQDLKLDSPWPSVTNYLFQGLLNFGIGEFCWYYVYLQSHEHTRLLAEGTIVN